MARCSINTGLDYNDLWCNYRDLSHIEELRDQAFKLVRSNLLSTLNVAEKLEELGRTADCHYDDNLNFHYYIALLTLYRQDLDKYIQECGCLTEEVLELYINKYQVKCPITACNTDQTLFRKLLKLFTPNYGYCNDEFCIEWGAEIECVCDESLPTEPTITITNIADTEISCVINNNGLISTIRLIDADTNEVVFTATNGETEWVFTDLETSYMYTIEVETFNCAGSTSSNVQVQTTPITVTVVLTNVHPVSATCQHVGEHTVELDSNFPVDIVIDSASQPVLSATGIAYVSRRVRVTTQLTSEVFDVIVAETNNGLPSEGSFLLTEIQYNTTIELFVDKYVVSWEVDDYRCVSVNNIVSGYLKYKTLSVSYSNSTYTTNIPYNATPDQLYSILASSDILSSYEVAEYASDTREVQNLVLCPTLPTVSVINKITAIPDSDYMTFDLSESMTGTGVEIGADEDAVHNVRIVNAGNSEIVNEIFRYNQVKSRTNMIWDETASIISFNTAELLPETTGTLIHTITYDLEAGTSSTELVRHPVLFTADVGVTIDPVGSIVWVNDGEEFTFTASASLPVSISSITVNDEELMITNAQESAHTITITEVTNINITV